MVVSVRLAGWKLALLLPLLLATAAGCTSGPVGTFDRTTIQKVNNGAAFAFRVANNGRLVGTVTANATVLGWAQATSLEGATAQAFDPDGTPLTDKTMVDGAGHFVMEKLRESRPRIFVEVDLKGLRYRGTSDAPRDRKDYPVNLDPGSTYLADKLRRATFDQDVPFDRLDGLRITETEEAINLYLDDDERRRVLEQTSPDLNAYSFDHFMDDHVVVKTAVYSLSPAILRGWKPSDQRAQSVNQSALVPVVAPKPVVKPTTEPDVERTPDPVK